MVYRREDVFVIKAPKTRAKLLSKNRQSIHPKVYSYGKTRVAGGTMGLYNAFHTENTTSQITEPPFNCTQYDYGNVTESLLFNHLTGKEEFKKADYIFGDKLDEILDLIFDKKMYFDKTCSVHTLVKLFQQSERQSDIESGIPNFVHFLVVMKDQAKFSPAQLRELQKIVGKRLNEFNLGVTPVTISFAPIPPKNGERPRIGQSKPSLRMTGSNLLSMLGKKKSSECLLNYAKDDHIDVPSKTGSVIEFASDKGDYAANSSFSLKRFSKKPQALSHSQVLFPYFDHFEKPELPWDSIDDTKAHISLFEQVNNYQYESYTNTQPKVNGCPLFISNAATEQPIYEPHFYKKNHYNFISVDKNNIAIVSILLEKSQRIVLIHTMEGSFHLKMLLDYTRLEILKAVNAFLGTKHKFVRCKDVGMQDYLLKFEAGDRIQEYKFGVLYCKENQTDEYDMFGNEHGSPDFNEFTNFLGESVELKGFTKYSGGLDVNRNGTGTHSVFTTFSGYQIMFHISTLLPYKATDRQQLERKRHLGNDVVVIIYKEGDQLFNPACMDSEFNHVFVVVQKVEQDPPAYKVEIAYKGGCPYPPYPILCQNTYTLDDDLRNFLLTKLINSERMALRNAQFQKKFLRTRKYYLEQMYELFIPKKYLSPENEL